MPRQYMTYAEVCERIRLSRPHITRMVRLGQFPRPVPIGPHHVRFVQDEVDAWQTSREGMREAEARRRSVGAVELKKGAGHAG